MSEHVPPATTSARPRRHSGRTARGSSRRNTSNSSSIRPGWTRAGGSCLTRSPPARHRRIGSRRQIRPRWLARRPSRRITSRRFHAARPAAIHPVTASPPTGQFPRPPVPAPTQFPHRQFPTASSLDRQLPHRQFPHRQFPHRQFPHRQFPHRQSLRVSRPATSRAGSPVARISGGDRCWRTPTTAPATLSVEEATPAPRGASARAVENMISEPRRAHCDHGACIRCRPRFSRPTVDCLNEELGAPFRTRPR